MARPITIIEELGRKTVFEVLKHYYLLKEVGTGADFAKKMGISEQDYRSIVKLGKSWQEQGKKDELIKLLSDVGND